MHAWIFICLRRLKPGSDRGITVVFILRYDKRSEAFSAELCLRIIPYECSASIWFVRCAQGAKLQTIRFNRCRCWHSAAATHHQMVQFAAEVLLLRSLNTFSVYLLLTSHKLCVFIMSTGVAGAATIHELWALGISKNVPTPSRSHWYRYWWCIRFSTIWIIFMCARARSLTRWNTLSVRGTCARKHRKRPHWQYLCKIYCNGQ